MLEDFNNMEIRGTKIFIVMTILCFVTIFAQRRCMPGIPNFRSKLKIKDNGFEDLVVAIHPSIPENFALIEDIKDVITEGSAALFTATKRRAFIREATILLPDSWNTPPGADKIDGDYTYAGSDIHVGPNTRQWHWRPFVKPSTSCELPSAEPIYYTSDYLRNGECASKKFGDKGKIFATLFAKYRWGVFDESPDDNNDYRWSGSSRGYLPNKCSKGVTGREKSSNPDQSGCSLNDKQKGRCKFIPTDTPGDRTARASLLYSNSISQIKLFCADSTNDDEGHNDEAKNDHNKFCGLRSVMEVIKCSPDFLNGKNILRNLKLEIPIFKVIKSEPSRLVSLVLDISPSMKDFERLTKMRRAATHYLQNIIPYNFSVSIVTFAEKAFTVAPMTLIDSIATRNSLIDMLPEKTTSATCIGCGILEGIKAIEAGRELGAAMGQRILVLTDGEENRSPMIKSIYTEVLQKKVTVDAIMYTVQDKTHQLVSLSKDTNGIVCFCPDGVDNDACLGSCFAKTVEGRETNETEQVIGVASESSQLSSLSTVNGTLLLDDTVGRSTEFIFNSDQITHLVIKMYTPGGTEITKGHTWYKEDTVSQKITIAPDGIAEPGRWFYQIINTGSSLKNVNIVVRSKGKSTSLNPVSVKGFLNSKSIDYSSGNKYVTIYASVTKGQDPVLNVNAVAKIQPPGSTRIDIVQLNDDGIGADLKKNDGVYSGYFYQFKTNGRYSPVITIDAGNSKPTVLKNTRKYGLCSENRKKRDIQTDAEYSETETLPLMPFTRVQPIDFFEATEVPNGNNPSALIEPARIADLRVSQIDDEIEHVTLTWTAVGADLDIGTASIYDIRYSNTTSQLKSNLSTSDSISDEHIVTGNVTSPLSSGTVETFILKLPESFTGDIIIFAVRAIDEFGNIGDVSNLAYGNLNEPNFEEEVTYTGMGNTIFLYVWVGLGALVIHLFF